MHDTVGEQYPEQYPAEILSRASGHVRITHGSEVAEKLKSSLKNRKKSKRTVSKAALFMCG